MRPYVLAIFTAVLLPFLLQLRSHRLALKPGLEA